MATIHIPEAEAIANLGALLDRVRAGEEILIENGSHPVAVLSPPKPKGRTIDESIAMAEAYSRELGYKPVMDEEFAADMEEIIRNRKPANWPAWDDSDAVEED
jgi:antitoxin (DNA-binding transcriptional repressor) of toxin-antitoxin stability system